MGDRLVFREPLLHDLPDRLEDAYRLHRIADGYGILIGEEILKGKINGRPALAGELDRELVVEKAKEESGGSLELTDAEVDDYLLTIDRTYAMAGHIIGDAAHDPNRLAQLLGPNAEPMSITQDTKKADLRVAQIRMAAQMVATRQAVVHALRDNVLVPRREYEESMKPTLRNIGAMARQWAVRALRGSGQE